MQHVGRWIVGCLLVVSGCDSSKAGESAEPPAKAEKADMSEKAEKGGDAEAADKQADAKAGGDEKAGADAKAGGDATAEGPVTREGVLEYKELPRTKSVEAYMGVEFTLKAEGGDTVLSESEAVPREKLIELNGKKISVKCTMEKGSEPDPRSSYPVGPGGGPLKRPDKCVVNEIVSK